MIARYRHLFNENYTEPKYRHVLQAMQERIGWSIPFRIAESPIFIPASFLQEMQQTSVALMEQLSENPKYLARARRRIPEGWQVPGEDTRPLFMSFDYAVARGAGGALVPCLTELQGFPSLLAFQYFLSQDFQQAYTLPSELNFLGDGLSGKDFERLFHRVILSGHAPETVALVDVRPWEQSTWPDFYLTERLCPGLAILCPTQIRKRGRQLYYLRAGQEVPIRRIFHRVVREELQPLEGEMQFRYQDDLDVEWAGHPNAFFIFSKYSLPYVDHPNVPRSFFLDEISEWPGDPSNYILKPLFSFSGQGLVLDLEADSLTHIPPGARGQFIIQEKIHYADAIESLEGAVRCEIRLMYIWQDRMICAMTLPRMSRGRLMGCAYNKTDPWTGHGVGLFEKREE